MTPLLFAAASRLLGVGITTEPPHSGLCFGKDRRDPCVGQDGITIELVIALAVVAAIVVYLALRINDVGRRHTPQRGRRRRR